MSCISKLFKFTVHELDVSNHGYLFKNFKTFQVYSSYESIIYKKFLEILFQNFSSLQFIPFKRNFGPNSFKFQNFSSLQFIASSHHFQISIAIFQNFSSLQFITDWNDGKKITV